MKTSAHPVPATGSFRISVWKQRWLTSKQQTDHLRLSVPLWLFPCVFLSLCPPGTGHRVWSLHYAHEENYYQIFLWKLEVSKNTSTYYGSCPALTRQRISFLNCFVFHEAIRNIRDKICPVYLLEVEEIFPFDPLRVFVADNLGDLFQLDQRVSIVRL